MAPHPSATARFFLFFIWAPWTLGAMLIGNPAEPGLDRTGIITSPEAFASLRLAFLEDYVYYQRFQDEFQIAGSDPTKTFARLSTNAGMATLNFENRLDLYTILGASRLELNREISSTMQFSWGFGGKLILFETQNLYFGLDIKYFVANQKPKYFISDGAAFNLANENFKFQYNETQFALGMCYKYTCIAPYIYATYLIARIEPDPMLALVRWPLDTSELLDATCKSVIANRRWGMAVGATLLSASKAALSVESRMFNQNAIDVNLDVRF